MKLLAWTIYIFEVGLFDLVQDLSADVYASCLFCFSGQSFYNEGLRDFWWSMARRQVGSPQEKPKMGRRIESSGEKNGTNDQLSAQT